MYTKNQLARFSGSAHKVCLGGGGVWRVPTNYVVTPTSYLVEVGLGQFKFQLNLSHPLAYYLIGQP